MSREAGNPDALRAHKIESAKKTRQDLELAIRRIVNGNPQRVKKGRALSPASVASEAAIDRSTLYRFHEPILSEIRKINDATPQKKLREKYSELAEAKDKTKEYRMLLEEEQANLAQMARQNYALNLRIKELESQLRDRDKLIAELQGTNRNVVPIHRD